VKKAQQNKSNMLVADATQILTPDGVPVTQTARKAAVHAASQGESLRDAAARVLRRASIAPFRRLQVALAAFHASDAALVEALGHCAWLVHGLWVIKSELAPVCGADNVGPEVTLKRAYRDFILLQFLSLGRV
jgi:hypothetical protein